MRYQKKKDIYILSIDGGGIRGVIPVMLLQELERILKSMGQDQGIASCFDLIAGTSTGGLIALALSAPADRIRLDLPPVRKKEPLDEDHKRQHLNAANLRDMYRMRFIANKQIAGTLEPEVEPEKVIEAVLPHFEPGQEEIVEQLRSFRSLFRRTKKSTSPEAARARVDLGKILSIYETRGEEIFPKSTFKQLQSIGQVFSEKYDERSLEALLQQIFGDLTIHEAETPVLVVTYDCNSGSPYVISSNGDDRYFMRDAARATSAAPTYFSPLSIYPMNSSDQLRCLIDGGVAANNPSMIAYLEARRIHPEAERIHILSLGTASKKFSMSPEQIVRGGVIGWMDPARGTPLYGVMQSSQTEMIDYTLERLPDADYHRFDGTLTSKHIRLDDASTENILLLKQLGAQMIEEHKENLYAFCRNMIS